MAVEFEIIDHSAEVLRELESRKEAILEAWGQNGVSYAKEIITRESRIDHGVMRNSITHQIEESESAVYVGTDNEYAPFHEFGTGAFHDPSDGKQGRKGWWVYVPGDTTHKVGDGKVYTKAQALWIANKLREEGLDAHITQGIKPIHMLKNGVADHINEFKKIAEDELKK